jgi:hypothetical protein
VVLPARVRKSVGITGEALTKFSVPRWDLEGKTLRVWVLPGVSEQEGLVVRTLVLTSD